MEKVDFNKMHDTLDGITGVGVIDEQEIEYLSVKELREIQMGLLIPILMDAGYEGVAGNYRHEVTGMAYVAQHHDPEIAMRIREKLKKNAARHVNNETHARQDKKPRQRSKVGGSVARVHEICSKNKDLDRKELIDLCVAAGINKNTAATQYAKWKRENQ